MRCWMASHEVTWLGSRRYASMRLEFGNLLAGRGNFGRVRGQIIPKLADE